MRKANADAQRAADPEGYAARWRGYRESWIRKNPTAIKDSGRRTNIRRYGITPEAYDLMLLEQGGVCAICREPETVTRQGKLRRLCIDHCHTTGRVRGLLCTRCNTAIGLLQDDIRRAQATISYLTGKELAA